MSLQRHEDESSNSPRIYFTKTQELKVHPIDAVISVSLSQVEDRAEDLIGDINLQQEIE